MKKIVVSPGHLWKTDSGLTALLIFLIVTIFAFFPIIDTPSGKLFVKIFYSLILISGATLVFNNKVLRIFIFGIILIDFIINWLQFFNGSSVVTSWSSAINSIFSGFLAIIILMQVFREGPITLHRITGAIAVYLLLGLMYGFLYHLIVLQLPEAFNLPSATITGRPDVLLKDLLYFSFVTLTTLGYGDITAVHPSVRMLVALEGLTGQLFPAILLARLVSLEIVHSRNK